MATLGLGKPRCIAALRCGLVGRPMRGKGERVHGMYIRAAFTLTALLASNVVNAEVVATCGAGEGWAYYVAGGLVPDAKSGWVKDKIGGGSFQLISAGDEYDIIFTDSTKRTLSAKGDGGNVSGFLTDDGNVIVQVVYTSLVETYIFWLSQKDMTVSFSQAKFGTPIRKHSLMVAPCRRGA